jgi:glutathione S-transferase
MTKPILTTTDLSSYGKTARLILAEKNVDYDLHKVEFTASARKTIALFITRSRKYPPFAMAMYTFMRRRP